MNEYIITFPNNPEGLPFSIVMCGVTYCDPKYKINRPDSPIYCFEYVYKGKGFIKCGEKEFKPCGGDAYILPAGLDHFYYSDPSDPWEKIWFNVEGDFIEKTLEVYGLKDVYHIKNVDVAPFFEKFLKNAINVRGMDIREQNFDMNAMDFLEIIQKLSNSLNQKEQPKKLTPDEKLKLKIDGLNDFSITFVDMVNELHYAKEYLIRAFKKRYGITPYQYLLDKKINTAKMLLDNTAMSLKEIAKYLAFDDLKVFCKFFKHRTGIGPTDYRKARELTEE